MTEDDVKRESKSQDDVLFTMRNGVVEGTFFKPCRSYESNFISMQQVG